ncbi:MucR family transcriptional regulator [Pyruvatibacter mobilis]|uniref:MucR family transcriptional regulator n=1 Tax=Pyruvatibacter mobilis TaxID=1712261 RepID=UPI003BAC2DD2
MSDFDKDLDNMEREEVVRLTADVIAAYVSNNEVSPADLPELIRSVHAALGGIGGAEAAQPAEKQKPAVPIKRSVTPDYIVCLEDGKRLKMLKRYLRSHYDMSPEDYRAKWNLPADYPMVAPNYSKQRSQFAKDIGLGTGGRGGRGRR